MNHVGYFTCEHFKSVDMSNLENTFNKSGSGNAEIKSKWAVLFSGRSGSEQIIPFSARVSIWKFFKN